MTLESLPPEKPNPEEGKRRFRSTIQFPYADLDDAWSVANAVHQNVGAGRCTEEQLAAWLHHDSVISGTYRQKLAAARSFGLIENEKGAISLTSLGRDIVDPSLAGRSRANAFLKVPLYAAIFERYKGGLLPPDVALERQMEELGVSPKVKGKARQAFRRSAEQAGFFSQGKNRLVMPPDVGTVSKPGEPKAEQKESGGDIPASEQEKGRRDNGGNGGDRGLHPFIQGLLDTLPAPDTSWPETQRQKWLRTAENIFGLIYKDGESE